MRLCKLEAANQGRSILEGYNRATDQWSFSFEGPFWKAVDRAHKLGKQGNGAKVAVIDTACDLSIPALEERVDRVIRCVPPPLPPENTEHGSAVALLIAKVAPKCRFDVYSVQRADGSIDANDVAYAVREAAESQAGILNVSLGAWQNVTDLDERIQHASPDAIEALLYDASPQHSRWALLNQILPDPDCVLCKEASAAVRSLKMVFAAAGNEADEIFCPARAEEVFAAGFQVKEKRIALPAPDGGAEVRTSAAVGAQSLFVDLPLEEVSGVLGTSFASPLYAGVAALGITAAEFSCYLSAIPMTTEAVLEHDAIKAEAAKLGKYTLEMKAPLQRVSDLYFNALKRLPHVHSELEFRKRGRPAGATITDPSGCFACGFLAYPLYVNFGLFLLEHGYPKDAKTFLQVARATAPWSDAAAADLGRTLEMLGDLKEALSLYDIALDIAPGIQPYEEARKRIRAKLSNSQ